MDKNRINIRPALTRRLMPESYFYITEGIYLWVAAGFHQGKRILLPAHSMHGAFQAVQHYIRAQRNGH